MGDDFYQILVGRLSILESFDTHNNSHNHDTSQHGVLRRLNIFPRSVGELPEMRSSWELSAGGHPAKTALHICNGCSRRVYRSPAVDQL